MLGDIDYSANTIKCALLTNGYSPSDADEFFSVVDANETSGTGYTAGGATLGTKTAAVVEDQSITAWAGTTAYVEGDIVRPSTANGHIYMCVVAGTTAAGEPTWPTEPREAVTDNTVTWVEVGSAYIKLSSANVQWANSTITARYAVFYKTGTAGVDDYVIGYIDFGQDESSSDAAFTLQPDSDLGWFSIFSDAA